MSIISYKQSCNSGDLIAALPGMKTAYEGTGNKAVIFQRLNMRAQYYQGAKHPVVDKDGEMVCMNEKMFSMMKPLIEAQEYVDSFLEWNGENVDVDIDAIRQGDIANIPNGPIAQWVFMAYPVLFTDISKPWMIIPEPDPIRFAGIIKPETVLVNLTERYRNDWVTYFFLKDYRDILLFTGTEKEHQLFQEQYKFELPRLIVNDFLELAQAITLSRFVLCNQSMIWNLCEAIKHKRILEMCKSAANCFPFGPNGYSFLQPKGAEILFKKLLK